SAVSVAGEGPNSAEAVVTQPARTQSATSLSSSLNPSISGQSVTITAMVSPPAATGTVQFTIDGLAAGSAVALSGGSATYTTSALSAGAHTITATYSGDKNNAGSTSPALLQSVKRSTTTT